MAHIQTPVKGFTGKVAGVTFADGVGTTDDLAALSYFERHGYDITSHAPNPPAGGKGDGGLPDGSKELTPKQKLQAEAKELGLSDEGTKDDLEARIAEHKAKVPPTDPQTPSSDGDKVGDEGKEQG